MTEAYVITYNPGDLYWRPNAAGYTRHLLEAGIYTREQAQSYERNRPLHDRAVSLDQEIARLKIVPEVLVVVLRLQGQMAVQQAEYARLQDLAFRYESVSK